MLYSSPGKGAVPAVQILFLDFDGVMHPEFCNESKHFMHRDTFETVMRSAPQVELVISSTWRQKRSLDVLKTLFSHDVASRIIGTTPLYAQLEDVPDTLQGYEREAECRDWLRQHGRAAQEWLWMIARGTFGLSTAMSSLWMAVWGCVQILRRPYLRGWAPVERNIL